MFQICIHPLFPTSRRAWRELPGGVPTPRATRRAVYHALIERQHLARAFTACLAVALMAVFAPAVQAGDLNVPHSFTAGTPAQAAQVNANFGAVETAVDDIDVRVAALEALVVALQSQNANQQSAINAIQGSNVMGINPYVQLTDIVDNNSGALYATVRITGANLQVVSGSGHTAGAANGLGNVIVGYNEKLSSDVYCSYGDYDNQVDCERSGGVWALDHRSGSHNLIIGSGNNYSRYGGLVSGELNTANNIFASISGGQLNVASGKYSSVSGGGNNHAKGAYSSVSAGSSNNARGNYSSVSGGGDNQATGGGSSVSGGGNNNADGSKASISGGGSHFTNGAMDWRAGSLFEDH